ncbi:MAG: hypothetical protein ACO1OQ_00510 [Rufibacter sp.]
MAKPSAEAPSFVLQVLFSALFSENTAKTALQKLLPLVLAELGFLWPYSNFWFPSLNHLEPWACIGEPVTKTHTPDFTRGSIKGSKIPYFP